MKLKIRLEQSSSSSGEQDRLIIDNDEKADLEDVVNFES